MATQQQIQETKEWLKSFVNSDSYKDFRLIYLNRTGNRLETLEQLLTAVADKLITARDLFEERLNSLTMSPEEEDYWLDNLQHFDYDNYFPAEDKQAQAGGVWIKVRTQHGFQLHLAKKATRKLNFGKLAAQSMTKLIKSLEGGFDEENEQKMESNRQASLHKRVQFAMGLQPYELWYWRTKSQKAYVTPCEYEIIDIQEFVDYVAQGDLKGYLRVRSLFTSQNKDKVFYLQSRGIRKELAQVYANLNQCYFEFNTKKAFEDYAEHNNARMAELFSS